MEKVVLIGGGGFAREVLDIFDAINARSSKYEVLGFIIDPQYASPGTIINDKPVLGGFDWFEGKQEEIKAICAVGAPKDRMNLIHRAEELGVKFCSIVHPNVTMTKWTNIGTGTIIGAGCVLTNKIIIGNHVHINLCCTIGHDVKVEDFVTISPGTNVSGNVVLSNGAYIGTNATIIEKMNIGEWSIVGAGSVIVRNVPPNSTVVGNPGVIKKTRPPGWHLH